VNALAAADRVLVPLQAEYYALEGLAQLVRSVELIRAASTRASRSRA
jgi:chromosome partitioning protein